MRRFVDRPSPGLWGKRRGNPRRTKSKPGQRLASSRRVSAGEPLEKFGQGDQITPHRCNARKPNISAKSLQRSDRLIVSKLTVAHQQPTRLSGRLNCSGPRWGVIAPALSWPHQRSSTAGRVETQLGLHTNTLDTNTGTWHTGHRAI